MGFDTSLSGLNAASSDLDVTSNNIANVSTMGFKESRAEFVDAVGNGVLLSTVRQLFDQGNLEFTDRELDMAVVGRGFFVTRDQTNALSFTRAGAFGTNADGFIVTSEGLFLQGFPVDANGNATATSLNSSIPLQIPDTFGTPVATSDIRLGLNLPSSAPDLVVGAFDPADPRTYSNTTSVTAYDTLGNSHVATVYYIKTDSATNTWETRSFLDGTALVPTGAETLQFDTAGQLVNPANGIVAYNAAALTNGAAPMSIQFDYSAGTSQYSAAFAVTGLEQDGNTTGRLSSLDFSETGVLRANYTNGTTLPVGKVALADFRNEQGLRQVGSTAWTETSLSGEPIVGESGTGRFGTIEGGSLESSNVELTVELVNLITAQRNFQANAKAIEASNTITQTIVNI